MQENSQQVPRQIYTQRISSTFYKFMTYFTSVIAIGCILVLLYSRGDEGITIFHVAISFLISFLFYQYSETRISVQHDPDTDTVTISDNGIELARMKVDLSAEKRYLNRIEYPIAEVLLDDIPFKYRHSTIGPRRGRLMINRFFLKAC